jgi:hypothetical protein
MGLSPAELAVPDDPENVERCVWQKVKHLEGIVEDDSDWPDDRGRSRTPRPRTSKAV